MLVISKTPLRISFFGGGTDYPSWIKEHGGAVLSTSIDKYSYLFVHPLPPFFSFKSKIVWSRIEEVATHNEICHPSVRETLRFMKIHDGVSIHYDGDLPARSGLGSSSSFTVGLLHALYALRGIAPDKKRLASEAIHIEQNCIFENVGAQDQVAAAFGGLSKITFHRNGGFDVSPLHLSGDRSECLQKHMLLFFTGFSRTASEIAAEQIKNIPLKNTELHALRTMVDDAVDILNGNGDWLGNFGRLLHKSWLIKKQLSPKISNKTIDNIYQKAIHAGALGGKILGAGGGGFILIFARPENHPLIRKSLASFMNVPFNFEQNGSVIMHHVSSETDHIGALRYRDALAPQ